MSTLRTADTAAPSLQPFKNNPISINSLLDSGHTRHADCSVQEKPALELFPGRPRMTGAHMTRFNRFAALLGVALVSTQAHAVDVSFTSGAGLAQSYGNTYTATTDGLTVSASAWSSTGRANQFAQAALTLTPGVGLGVCSSQEKVGCTAKNFADALGNKGADDLILFTFSSAVTLQSLSMIQFGGDSDLSLWAGAGAFSPAGLKAGQMGTATLYDNTSNVDGIRDVNLASFTGSYDWLAVAARIGQNDDFAKLRALTITPVAQPVPDAAPWMTMLAGLGLVGFRVSRRRQI